MLSMRQFGIPSEARSISQGGSHHVHSPAMQDCLL